MPTRPVRVVTGCKNSMPVRVVAEGGSPVRIVTSGGDPVRIVTQGISDPVRVIGGGLAPDAPTFVSGEVGTVDASTVVVTFSTDITAPCGDCALGFTVLVNGNPDAITACVIVGGNAVRLTLTTAVVFGDVVTVSYDSTVGCIMESTGVTDLATFAAQAVTNNVAAVGNGLLNSLIAFWPGNEINGDALDLHTNGLTLTDTNTVTSNPGKVYALARQYTIANSEYHTRPGDDALLSAGDVDFTFAFWVYLNDKISSQGIVGKGFNAGQYEYRFVYSTAADRFRFIVSPDGTASAAENADVLGSPSATTWYFIVGWHDSVANTINIQINDGAIDSQAYATGVFNGSDPFRIGMTAGPAYMNGRIGPTAFWKSNAGLGGVLTAAQRTALYNAGAGLPYASFTV